MLFGFELCDPTKDDEEKTPNHSHLSRVHLHMMLDTYHDHASLSTTVPSDNTQVDFE